MISYLNLSRWENICIYHLVRYLVIPPISCFLRVWLYGCDVSPKEEFQNAVVDGPNGSNLHIVTIPEYVYVECLRTSQALCEDRRKSFA
jgi:hypothetical protein